MMSDGMIHIPARKKEPATEQAAVKLSPEAYNALIEIYNESQLSIKQIASTIILQSIDRIVYDKEE